MKSPVLNGELSLLLGVHDPEKVGDLISVDQICPLFPELGRTSAGHPCICWEKSEFSLVFV